MRAAQALAAIRGRDYVLPDDVKSLAHAVLTHRLILDDREQLRGVRPEDILAEVLAGITVPVTAATGARLE